MKNLKLSIKASLIAGSIILVSSAGLIKKNDKSTLAPITKLETVSVDNIAEEPIEVINKEKAIIEEERNAFEKGVSNPEFIDRPEFRSVSHVTIDWDSNTQNYYVEFSNSNETYSIYLPEERLISYIMKRTQCEYLFVHKLESPELLEQLSSLRYLKELSIYDTSLKELDCLKEFKTLEAIRIENCPYIKDINFFSELPNILAVEINGTSLSDLTPLSNCKNLKNANLRCNHITNPEVLESLENLISIKLEYNAIKDKKSLKYLVDKGLITEDMAESIVDTTTNHKLIFTTAEKTPATSLIIKYFDADGEYYAEALDSSGKVISLTYTDEPYDLYDISTRLSEPKYLSVKNCPVSGYIYHLKDKDKFTTIEIKDCDFESFAVPRYAENIIIHNCPNLSGTFEASIYPGLIPELKYLEIEDTNIENIVGLSSCQNLKSVQLRNNNIESYEFLAYAPALESARVTIDNEDIGYTLWDTLSEKGVELTVYGNDKNDKTNSNSNTPSKTKTK